MILQGRGQGMLVFRQTDHALLSGAFADAWGGQAVAPVPRAGSVVVAAARHDDGWAQWELAPKLNGQGRVVDFIGVPVDEHTALYRRGIDLVVEEDLYAGYVVSLHGERLYTRPFHPGIPPRIDMLSGGDHALAEDYVRHEVARQERLLPELGGDPEALRAELEEAWRLLQVWDRLSLFVCLSPLDGDGSAIMPPVRGASGDVQITVRAEAGALVCDPYPFREPRARFQVEAFILPQQTWDDEATFRRDLRAAPRALIEFEAHPG